jgi:SNF2 family DNA or RNA helicase
MTKWVGKNRHCPTCRNAVSVSDILSVDLRVKEKEVAKESGDTEKEPQTSHNYTAEALKYGSKPAAVLEYCRQKLGSGGGEKDKMLLFSSYNQSLKVMAKTLKDEGFFNLTCLQGDKNVAEIMEEFKTSKTKRILLLNSCNLAAGTNLQCASHVVFLEPAGDNKAAALSIETQAIGRCVEKRLTP